MDMQQQAWQLGDILENVRTAYMWVEPEVPDFTIHATAKVCIQTQKGRVDLELKRETVWNVLSLLSATVFSKDYLDVLFAWNLKPLFSYFRFYGSKWVIPTSSVIDLHVVENFLNLNKKRPENFVEAINRGKVVAANKGWRAVYKTIHQPLMFRVLPAIETSPLLNEQSKQQQFAYYEIEGQSNGRMNCMKKFKYGYLPLNMSKELRQVLKPKGYNLRFLAADYRSCEVSVLQWLSGDAKLKQIIESGDDLHSAIFQIITEGSCDTEEKREKSKRMFLPVMYGCGAPGLAKNLTISVDLAKELIRRINYHFKTACEWLASKQKEAETTGSCRDYFGRERTFKEGDAYLARNLCVQGPAATFCQEKMIELFNALEGKNTYLSFCIHDAVGLVTTIPDARDSYLLTKQVLESESKLCPGLAVRVKIKFGAKLSPTKEIWKD